MSEDENQTWGRKNYEEYLRAAREALTEVKYLPDFDRGLIERGIYYLEDGYSLLKSDDPEVLRRAAGLLMIGGYYLGGSCVVLPSHKKYFDIKRQGPAGKASAIIRQAIMTEWQDKVIELLNGMLENNPKLKGEGAARIIEKNHSLPVGHRRLTAFIQQELRRRKQQPDNGDSRLNH